MTLQPRQDLLLLEDRLLRDMRNFGVLLSKIPRNIFVEHDGNIVLNPEFYPVSNIDKSPVFAYFSQSGTVKIDQRRPWVQPDHLDSIPSISFHTASSGKLTEKILAFMHVQPISWITQPLSVGDSWEQQVQALIDYSLLNWAFENRYAGDLPQPDYDHLSQLFTVIKKTQQYEKLMIVREDVESVYFAKAIYGADGIQDPETGLTTPIHESWTAPMNDSTHDLPYTNLRPADQRPSSPPLDPTPTVEHSVSGFDRSAATHDLGSCKESPRDRSTTMETSTTLEYFDPNTSTTTISPDIEMVDLASTSKLPHQTPSHQSESNEKITHIIDPELNRLYEGLGRDLLSLLPDLRTMNFEKMPIWPTGFLPFVLMIGAFKQSASSSLRGHQVWAVFKTHAVNAKCASAPRLHLWRRRIDTGMFVFDSLKLSEILAHVDFVPILSNLEQGKPGDMQLKAIVKYYYILAANAKLHGFENHGMPVNNTFIEQLRTICKKQKKGNTGEHPAPPPRKRRKVNPTSSLPTPPDSEDATPVHYTQGLKRSSRRFRSSPNASLSTSPAPGRNPNSKIHTTTKPTPRKLALGGPPLVKPTNSKRPINEFLDTNLTPNDSSGESGDEIPCNIPSSTSSLLRARAEKKRMLNWSRTNHKLFTGKKDTARYTMRSLKGQMTRGTAPLETLQRAFRLQEMELAIYAGRVKVFDAAVQGYQAQKKRCDDDVKVVQSGVVRVWEAYQVDAVRVERVEREEREREEGVRRERLVGEKAERAAAFAAFVARRRRERRKKEDVCDAE